MESQRISVNAALQALIVRAAGVWRLDACGVTRSQTSIPSLVHRDAYAPTTRRIRMLVVGGLSGRPQDVALVLRSLDAYIDAGERLSDTLALSAVPCVNIDGLTQEVAPENGVGGRPENGYPPEDNFFDDAHNPERRYLWRWAGMQAPDIVLELRAGDTVMWESSVSDDLLTPALSATRMEPDETFLTALGADTPNGLGPILGLRLTISPEALATQLDRLWHLLLQTPGLQPSSARRALDARQTRTPLGIARLLASVYGHRLDPVVYTQGMSIGARLRLARLEPTVADPAPDIVRLVEPYMSGAKLPFDDQAGSATLAGMIWGSQLAEATQDRRYADLIISIAERYRPGVDGGAPPPSDPDFRTEDMFMNAAMLGRAFRLTGTTRYLDLLTNFLLEARTQQDNGLFWHGRSTPYFWGRGNGFAALGYSETLSYLPNDYPSREALLTTHRRHLAALRQRQLPSGMYAQVLDVPGSYQEFTVTCMLGYAMARGLRRGWLDASYQDAMELAWQGVVERIDDNGGLVDCCTNTGVQRSLHAYIDRPAIFGYDDRGGAMALWFALELEQLRRTS